MEKVAYVSHSIASDAIRMPFRGPPYGFACGRGPIRVAREPPDGPNSRGAPAEAPTGLFSHLSEGRWIEEIYSFKGTIDSSELRLDSKPG